LTYEEQQEADNAHAASITSLLRDALEKENRKLLEENERLRKVEERLMRENVKLREDGREVKAENWNQERQSQIDEAEIHRLRECYRVIMEEKVALAEQLAVSDLDTISRMMLTPVEGSSKTASRTATQYRRLRGRKQRLQDIALAPHDVQVHQGRDYAFVL
jgi:predicted nuclease with TOPRIM domain